MSFMLWFFIGAASVIAIPHIFRFLYREGYAFMFLVGNGGPLPYFRYLKDKVIPRKY